MKHWHIDEIAWDRFDPSKLDREIVPLIKAAAMVERNQIVTLTYQVSGLVIRTEGRALARAGAGEVIEVMNLASKTKITGRVGLDGSVTVGPPPSP